MSGSSRSLLRNIASVFENWPNNKNWDKAPSQDIKDLNDSIYAYKEKHNSLSSLSSQLNNELRSIHRKYIDESSEISKEVLFLDILTRLSPVLSADEIKVWLSTYLLPAIESTGFDKSFVSKAREFVRSVSAETYPTDDPQLRNRRASIARMVSGYILRIYLGTDQEAYGLIGLKYKDASSKDEDTHENIEKVRFMETNCAITLREYGQRYSEDYFTLLNTYFHSVDNRLKTLSLITSFVASNTFHAKTIIKTPLFKSILVCLSNDQSETIIASALSLMVMLMGKLCDKIATHLPDLLVIYTRLLLWSGPTKHGISREVTPKASTEKEEWVIAEPDSETVAMSSHLYHNDEFNLSYFTTLLYAFFPMNFMRFGRSPFQFWTDYRPKFLSEKRYHDYPDILQIISSRTREFCEQMSLHPNFLQQVSAEEELDSPLKWILKDNEGLRLNPTYMLWLPDRFVLPKYFHEKLQELSIISPAASSNFGPQFSKDTRSGSHWSANVGSNKSSKRGSVDVASEDMSTPRRSSLVPSSLLSEKSPNEPRIKFKNVDYGLSKSGPGTASPKPSQNDSSTASETDSGVSDLFSAHEKLYKMSTTRRNSVQQDLQNPQVATGNFQATSKSASALLNEQLKGKNNEEVSSSKGGALEFYQRELLLCKNELEFTIYMKYLNKLNYIKLKTQMSELSRKLAEAITSSPSEQSKTKNTENLRSSLEELQASSKAALMHSQAETAKLSERVVELQKSLEAVTLALTQSRDENEVLQNDYDTYKQSVESIEAELRGLKIKQTADANKSRIHTYPETSSPFITEHEEELQNLRTELEMARSQNHTIQREVRDLEEKLDLTVRGYEKQVASLKLDLGGAVREQVRHYERRIQELNTTIMKYATSIEEKNNMIVQLSTSKPIKIPGGRDMQESESSPVKPRNIPVPSRQNRNFEYDTPDQRTSRNMQDFFETRSSSGSSMRSSASAQLAQPSTRPQAIYRSPTTSSIPIIKGRGGYQKRSKRM
ncbi:uncharacterized protein CXQ87_003301 [Candidozyma duobushaemuli]|uniref:Uncharacterized protein n=1 Tax=Candidozyma duobushaemuli TaxID=1231522 RepID=A0A2V1ABK1_9ASCO|nr:uncharacterized protein CXQ87_003301 [[Candida] duobushaemulonis]PVH15460.1 hypothetical protein CXQ87_003301 [[Candida] duobushaemulonis]